MGEAVGRELHVIDENAPCERSRRDVIAMAIVAQANVAQLRTAEARSCGVNASEHEIRTPSPGGVTAFREALIDFQRVRELSAGEVHLLLHETWGQFCVFCWSMGVPDPQEPPVWGAFTNDEKTKCASAIALKTAEIEGFLWRMRFELRVRIEDGFRDSAEFAAVKEVASRIPAEVFGVPVDACDDHALLAASCEHAGMLGAIRWLGDGRRVWGEAGITDVDAAGVLGTSD